MFADVQSANIVGYAVQSNDAKAHPTMGCGFVNINTGNSIFLKDIKATGMTYQDDFIQFLDPATSKVDTDKIYSYYESGDEDEGWYWFNLQDLTDERYAGEDEIPAGTACLATFNTSHNIKITYAGQVLSGPVVIDTKINDNYVAYMFIANPYPTGIKMKDFAASGMEYQTDFIQFIDPELAIVDATRVYSYYESGDEDEGWYWFNLQDLTDERYAGEDDFNAGDGFLCTVDPNHQVKFTFKAIVD